MEDVVIVSAVRTPIGAFGGGLSSMSAVDLGAVVIEEALQRAQVDPAEVDEVLMGNILAAGLGMNPARQAAVKANLPVTVPAMTVNKMCGSGLKTVALAAQAIKLGDADVMVAGGMESMSGAPYPAPPSPVRPPHGPRPDRRLHAQRRPLVPPRRLPHGHHRREPSRHVRNFPRRNGRVRRPQPAPRLPCH